MMTIRGSEAPSRRENRLKMVHGRPGTEANVVKSPVHTPNRLRSKALHRFCLMAHDYPEYSRKMRNRPDRTTHRPDCGVRRRGTFIKAPHSDMRDGHRQELSHKDHEQPRPDQLAYPFLHREPFAPRSASFSPKAITGQE